jgi:hypothetical protein
VGRSVTTLEQAEAHLRILMARMITQIAAVGPGRETP